MNPSVLVSHTTTINEDVLQELVRGYLERKTDKKIHPEIRLSNLLVLRNKPLEPRRMEVHYFEEVYNPDPIASILDYKMKRSLPSTKTEIPTEILRGQKDFAEWMISRNITSGNNDARAGWQMELSDINAELDKRTRK